MALLANLTEALQRLQLSGCCSTQGLAGVAHDAAGVEDAHKCMGDLSLPRDATKMRPDDADGMSCSTSADSQPLPQQHLEQEVTQQHEAQSKEESEQQDSVAATPEQEQQEIKKQQEVIDSSIQTSSLEKADVKKLPCEHEDTTPAVTVEQQGDLPVQQEAKGARAPKRQPVRKTGKPRQPKQGRAEEALATEQASCPASRKEEDLERELKILKKKDKQAKQMRTDNVVDKQDAGGKGMAQSYDWVYNTCISEGERHCKKELFKTFYREQYAKIGTYTPSDASKYDSAEGLKIKGGHQYMPPPKDVELPPDYKKPVGALSKMQLREFNCDSPRRLVCITGDLFDVTHRPDKYGADGPYAFMAGHDITWGLMCGDDGELQLDMYFDVFKAGPADVVDRKLQGLLSWWAFFEKEYGEPVGRLEVYDKEWELPEPPHIDTNECSVM